jgi:hypothetical protein
LAHHTTQEEITVNIHIHLPVDSADITPALFAVHVRETLNSIEWHGLLKGWQKDGNQVMVNEDSHGREIVTIYVEGN